FPDEDDEERSRNQFKRVDPANWPIAYWLAIFVGVGLVAFRGIAVIMSLGEEGLKNPLLLVNRRIEKFSSDSEIQKAGIRIVPLSVVASSTQAVAPRAAPPDAPTARAPQPGDWRLDGTVYDLVTLQPVPDCELIFSARS